MLKQLLASILLGASVLGMPSSPAVAASPATDGQPAEIDHLELSVKEYSNKNLPLGEVIDVSGRNPLVTKVVYDKGYRGRLCFISCNFYDGYTSKWTDYLLSLQPYQTTCFAAAGGCNTTTYPRPDSKIKLIIGKQLFELSMVDSVTYSYYLPLEARKALAVGGNERVAIQTSWEALKDYEIGKKTKAALAHVLNLGNDVSVDQLGFTPREEPDNKKSSVEDRLKEIGDLFSKGLISKDEYEAMRKKALDIQ